MLAQQLSFCKLASTGVARADPVHALPSAVVAVLLLQAGIYTRPQVLRVLTLRKQLQELQALLAEQEVCGQTAPCPWPQNCGPARSDVRCFHAQQ